MALLDLLKEELVKKVAHIPKIITQTYISLLILRKQKEKNEKNIYQFNEKNKNIYNFIQLIDDLDTETMKNNEEISKEVIQETQEEDYIDYNFPMKDLEFNERNEGNEQDQKINKI